MKLDPRCNAVRDDLADSRLRGQVQAARFVEGRPALVATGLADLRRKPAATAPLDAQLWYGESLSVFECKNGWAWVQGVRDGYVGFTPVQALAGASDLLPSHQVSVPLTYRFPEPSIKAPPLDSLPMGALLRSIAKRDGFLELHDGGYVFVRHAASADCGRPDWAETAQRFLGVPYLWGGRSFGGIDCSGLVQTGLLIAGHSAPRDSDMLRDDEALGRALAPNAPRQRGDLLFSPGHVIMALDEADILHANAYHLATVREAFSLFAERIAARGEAITLLRRPYCLR
ncbi:MAG: C40 family peptidase [Rhodospirillales bacterium]|nr:C40 family peptidase [Rhodospirillales bacterium]